MTFLNFLFKIERGISAGEEIMARVVISIFFALFINTLPALAEEQLTTQLLCEQSPWQGTFVANKAESDIELIISCEKKFSATLSGIITKSDNPYLRVGDSYNVNVLFLRLENGALKFNNPKWGGTQYELRLEDKKLIGTAIGSAGTASVALAPTK